MNFRVRCTKTKDGRFVKGEKYVISDGYFYNSLGEREFSPGENFKDWMNYCNWVDYDFELVEEEKPFTKDDLKVGYVVEQRNGDLLMVMQTADGDMVTVNNAGFNWITEYDDKLKLDYLADGGADIVKIYGLSGSGVFAHKLSAECRKLLWERKPEIHELTAEEAYKIIAEKKGIPVESLRVKWDR